MGLETLTHLESIHLLGSDSSGQTREVSSPCMPGRSIGRMKKLKGRNFRHVCNCCKRLLVVTASRIMRGWPSHGRLIWFNLRCFLINHSQPSKIHLGISCLSSQPLGDSAGG